MLNAPASPHYIPEITLAFEAQIDAFGILPKSNVKQLMMKMRTQVGRRLENMETVSQVGLITDGSALRLTLNRPILIGICLISAVYLVFE